MKKKEFMSGVATLTLSMMITEAVSMGFKVYLSNRIGGEGLGLYHLILSVYAPAVAVAVSGVPLAMSKSVAAAKTKGVKSALLKKAIPISLFCGGGSCILLFILAPFVGEKIIHRADAVLPLRLLALSLPPIAVSGAMGGFFAGEKNVSRMTIDKSIAECGSVLFALIFLNVSGNSKSPCVLLTLSTAMSAYTSLICNVLLCRKSLTGISSPDVRYGDILSISLPVAGGNYIRSALSAAENLIIPSALRAFGRGNPLALYGTLKGMAVPILTFPYVFLQSLISLLIPEISSRNTGGKKRVVSATLLSLGGTAILGLGVSVFLLAEGNRLGEYLYKSTTAGKFITALSLLALPMYIDSVTDAILKGMGEQVYCLKINAIDSALRLPLIWFLLPRFGVGGYIAIMYISELTNLSLSAYRLKKVLAERP